MPGLVFFSFTLTALTWVGGCILEEGGGLDLLASFTFLFSLPDKMVLATLSAISTSPFTTAVRIPGWGSSFFRFSSWSVLCNSCLVDSICF